MADCYQLLLLEYLTLGYYSTITGVISQNQNVSTIYFFLLLVSSLLLEAPAAKPNWESAGKREKIVCRICVIK